MPRLQDGASYVHGHLRGPNGDTILRFDVAANQALDLALRPIGDVDVIINGQTVTVDGVPHVVALSTVEQLMGALAADPPLQEEVLQLVNEMAAGAVTASTPDYAVRRAELLADIETLRTWVQQAKDEIAAMPAPAQRSNAQKEAVKIRRFLILFSKIVWNGLLRPVAGDLGTIPE